ncbi:MAG: Uma2 family endonuclease [Bryobacteraceae bacterium]|nr:Uma2 family endonuclease [Bryobacteraceae bacterium]
MEEYLRRSFADREPEYRDGVLEERPMPNFVHVLLQAFFVQFLQPWMERDELTVVAELRVRLRAARFLLPDICIFTGAPTENLPASPPLAVIEVLSPDDSHEKLLGKLAEYHDWGVENIWVVDPDSRTLHVFDGDELRTVNAFELPAYSLTLPQSEVFRKVNQRFPK